MTNLENISIAFLRKIEKVLLEASTDPSFDIEALSVYTSSNLAVLQLPCTKRGKYLALRTVLDFRESLKNVRDRILALRNVIL